MRSFVPGEPRIEALIDCLDLITGFAIAFVAAPQFRWGPFGIMAGTVAGNLLIVPFALRRVALILPSL